MAKTPGKTTETRVIALVPQPHGGAIRKGGTPGNRGGGRPPDEFKQMCRELASSAAVRANVQEILASPKNYPNLYIGALKWASEHGYGKPVESVAVDMNADITVRQEWTFGAKKVAF